MGEVNIMFAIISIYSLISLGWEYNYWTCIILHVHCFLHKYDLLIGIFNHVNVGYLLCQNFLLRCSIFFFQGEVQIKFQYPCIVKLLVTKILMDMKLV